MNTQVLYVDPTYKLRWHCLAERLALYFTIAQCAVVDKDSGVLQQVLYSTALALEALIQGAT